MEIRTYEISNKDFIINMRNSVGILFLDRIHRNELSFSYDIGNEIILSEYIPKRYFKDRETNEKWKLFAHDLKIIVDNKLYYCVMRGREKIVLNEETLNSEMFTPSRFNSKNKEINQKYNLNTEVTIKIIEEILAD